MRFLLRLPVFALVLGLLAALPAANAAPYEHAATGIIFPDRLGTLPKHSQISDYEATTPGLGISVAYNGPGITVTIYLYTLGLDTVPADLDSPLLNKHFKDSARDVQRAGELGYYEKVRSLPEGRSTWSSRPDATRSLHARFSYTQRGVERLSHLHLLGFKNHFLKIRYTHDEAVTPNAEAVLTKLLEELDTILRETNP